MAKKQSKAQGKKPKANSALASSPNPEQTIVWLAAALIAVFFIIWGLQAWTGRQPATTATPGSTDTSNIDLKVTIPVGTNSADPQQTTSPDQVSNDPVQSGQSSLQPAGTTDQMAESLKQELGLQP
jgi:hypothetical protein